MVRLNYIKAEQIADITKAEKIGFVQATKAITIGLVVAYSIMALLSGPYWLLEFNYASNLIFSAVVLYSMGYVIGGLTGKLIIINKYPSVLVGIISGFLIIWTGTFIGSLIGFVGEGLSYGSSISSPFEDYILKPILLVSVWGFIPIVGIGIWYGLSIKQRGRKLNQIRQKDENSLLL